MYDLFTQTFIYFNFKPVGFEHPDSKNAVRGEVDLQAVELVAMDANTTRYIMYSKSDPKVFAIPQSLIQSKAKNSGSMPLYFKQNVDKLFK
jgi:hypothetical protein